MRLHRRGWRLPALIALGLLSLPAGAQERPHFDYWMLTMAWSPEHCAQKPAEKQCKQAIVDHSYRGFVIAELAPMLNSGKPSPCPKADGKVPEELLSRTREVMLSFLHVRQQWKSYGGCTQGSLDEHFMFVERVYRKIEIPDQYRNPNDYLETTVPALQKAFAARNPGFAEDSFSVACASNRRISEIRVCFDTDLNPRSCGREIKGSCPDGRILLRPSAVSVSP